MPVVQLVVDRLAVELAIDALWQAGPSGVAEEELPDGRVRLTADVRDLAEVPGMWALTVVEPDDEADLDAWRSFAQPVRAGRTIVLQPAWQPSGPTGPEDRIVALDPGRTFGSGSHPSTRLAVAALEAHLRPGAVVLDVGAGSGVLAIVAGLLGAASALAIDVDPAAPEVIRANARANGVDGLVAVSSAPLAEVAGRFDLVVANIGLRVLTDLAPSLWARVSPEGALVLAGLLDEQVDPLLAAAYPAAVEVERTSLEGWAATVLRR